MQTNRIIGLTPGKGYRFSFSSFRKKSKINVFFLRSQSEQNKKTTHFFPVWFKSSNSWDISNSWNSSFQPWFRVPEDVRDKYQSRVSWKKARLLRPAKCLFETPHLIGPNIMEATNNIHLCLLVNKFMFPWCCLKIILGLKNMIYSQTCVQRPP